MNTLTLYDVASIRAAILFLISSLVFSSSGIAQDKPNQTAVVDSFKQKIHEVLNSENTVSGIEHARVISSEAVAKPVHAKRKMVHKDGTPCGAFHSGWCHDIWVDDSGGQYVDDAGKPCDPAEKPNCHVPGPPHLEWRRSYTEKVSDFSFDVKITDSLVTPYTGVLNYKQVFWETAGHPTKEEAQADSNFVRSWTNPQTSTYGYQDGQWKLLK
jgi:hypothetical protein